MGLPVVEDLSFQMQYHVLSTVDDRHRPKEWSASFSSQTVGFVQKEACFIWLDSLVGGREDR